MFDDLRGKNVVVTGAADGLGKVIAEQFIAAGSKVIVIARRETAWMRKTEKTQCQLLLSDIRDTDKVRAFLADLEDAGESVQVLVNNAGVLVERPLIDICDDDWDQTFDINLKATFQLCQLFANHMKNNEHCSIINAASF
nr:SDR family oxidoreductase [Phycisphaerae bacterium]NIV44748.1 SDR family NAD(P)-dependent oxidoreductase [Candidatus Bathyarchaeota archaeon]NIX28369.1 SDR family NAD(P)-dependent oxidoreductase [Phycisphaerae bacterium]